MTRAGRGGGRGLAAGKARRWRWRAATRARAARCYLECSASPPIDRCGCKEAAQSLPVTPSPIPGVPLLSQTHTQVFVHNIPFPPPPLGSRSLGSAPCYDSVFPTPLPSWVRPPTPTPSRVHIAGEPPRGDVPAAEWRAGGLRVQPLGAGEAGDAQGRWWQGRGGMGRNCGR